MSSENHWQVDSTSQAMTEHLAEKLASNLKGGEVIELISDLGGGKTTFVRGLVRGLGSQDIVTSPTFKISNLYHSPRFDIYHFDFYRLNEPGVVAHELAEAIADKSAVCVIEWANIVRNVLPPKHLSIILNHRGEDKRHIQFSYHPELSYLLKDLD